MQKASGETRRLFLFFVGCAVRTKPVILSEAKNLPVAGSGLYPEPEFT